MLKQSMRNPESVITFTIHVPQERVLTRTESYPLRSGKKITLIKYAIAGGISFDDIVQENLPQGGRYLNKGLAECQAQKETWRKPKG